MTQGLDPVVLFGLYGATGLTAGILAGLLGVGGGVVIVPALTYVFESQGLPAEATVHCALGTSLGTILFTSASSVRAHHRRRAVLWGVFGRITPGILIGTYLGSAVAARLSTTALKAFFAGFLFLVATQLLGAFQPKPKRALPGPATVTAAGLVIGGISSLVGIGGGSMSVPFMVWCNVKVHQAIGTSAAVGFPIALAGAIGYVVHAEGTSGVPHAVGYIYLPALAGVAALSMLTAPLGARLAHSLNPSGVKKVFALFLVLTACRMALDVVAG
jgi:uncharacterized membrane protein YfcA